MLKNLLLISLITFGCLDAQQTPIIVQGEFPTFPQLAIQARLSGRVRVKLRIVGGAVTEAHVEYSDRPIFNDPTLRCVRSWRFEQSTTTSLETDFVYETAKSEGGVAQNPAIELRLPGYVRLVATPVRPTTVH